MELEEARAPWPVPTDWPLYVPVERAAQIAGVSYEYMRAACDRRDGEAIPHIDMGKRKKLVRVSAIPAYMASAEAQW